jgi:hypothetical protein
MDSWISALLAQFAGSNPSVAGPLLDQSGIPPPNANPAGGAGFLSMLPGGIGGLFNPAGAPGEMPGGSPALSGGMSLGGPPPAPATPAPAPDLSTSDLGGGYSPIGALIPSDTSTGSIATAPGPGNPAGTTPAAPAAAGPSDQDKAKALAGLVGATRPPQTQPVTAAGVPGGAKAPEIHAMANANNPLTQLIARLLGQHMPVVSPTPYLGDLIRGGRY